MQVNWKRNARQCTVTVRCVVFLLVKGQSLDVAVLRLVFDYFTHPVSLVTFQSKAKHGNVCFTNR